MVEQMTNQEVSEHSGSEVLIGQSQGSRRRAPRLGVHSASAMAWQFEVASNLYPKSNEGGGIAFNPPTVMAESSSTGVQ